MAALEEAELARVLEASRGESLGDVADDDIETAMLMAAVMQSSQPTTAGAGSATGSATADTDEEMEMMRAIEMSYALNGGKK